MIRNPFREPPPPGEGDRIADARRPTPGKSPPPGWTPPPGYRLVTDTTGRRAWEYVGTDDAASQEN